MWGGWTFKCLHTIVHHFALDTDYGGGDEYYLIIVTTTSNVNYLFTVSVLNDTLLVYTTSPPLWYTLHCQLMNHLQLWQRAATNALFHCMLCPHLCLLNLSVAQRHFRTNYFWLKNITMCTWSLPLSTGDYIYFFVCFIVISWVTTHHLHLVSLHQKEDLGF